VGGWGYKSVRRKLGDGMSREIGGGMYKDFERNGVCLVVCFEGFWWEGWGCVGGVFEGVMEPVSCRCRTF